MILQQDNLAENGFNPLSARPEVISLTSSLTDSALLAHGPHVGQITGNRLACTIFAVTMNIDAAIAVTPVLIATVLVA